LTPRERVIFPLLMEGLSHKEIAVRTNLTERTSKHHSSNIYKKYAVANRAELMRGALTQAEG
jgi:two-component system, NarL family, nitrate/nitrite response regulator NarL